jgi:methionine transaminase
MSALAMQHKAINLGQGFPDFEMPAQLHALVAKAMKDGYNQYAPMPGWLPLREALSQKVLKLYNAIVNPAAEITITPGGTYAIYTCLTAILHAGDEVIVFEPAYDSYIPNIEINGAVPVCIPLQFPAYRIPWQKVQAAINKKTKAIIINTPHNPTGTVLTEEDMVQLQKLVQDTNIFIVSDEVYEHLIFDNIPHQSILRYPELLKRSFVCFSFGKVYHCTGWKLGYCIAPERLSHEFRKVHQFNSFSCNMPAQVALAEYISHEDSYLQLGNFLQNKRDYFIELMKQTRFKLMPSFGSYFICATYKEISDEPDTDFAIRLTKENGVAAIPLSAFYQHGNDDKVLRFCFAKKEETLIAAVKKISF